MTGRELIVYILENNLENEQVFNNGVFLGFLTIPHTAINFNVGESTIRAWIKMNMIPSITIGDTVYIPANVKDPRKEQNK